MNTIVKKLIVLVAAAAQLGVALAMAHVDDDHLRVQSDLLAQSGPATPGQLAQQVAPTTVDDRRDARLNNHEADAINTLQLIGDINALINRLETQISDVETSGADLGDELEELKDHQETKNDELDDKVAELVDKDLELDDKVAELKTELIASLETDITELRNELITALDGKATGLEGKDRELEDKVAELETELIASLEAAIATLDTKFTTALDDKVTELKIELITSQETAIAALDDKVTELKNELITSLQGKATGLEDKDRELEGKVATNAEDINKLKNKIDEQEDEIFARETKITALEEEDKRLDAKDNEIDKTNNKQQSEINALETKDDNMTATLNDKVAALEARDTELQGSLDSASGRHEDYVLLQPEYKELAGTCWYFWKAEGAWEGNMNYKRGFTFNNDMTFTFREKSSHNNIAEQSSGHLGTTGGVTLRYNDRFGMNYYSWKTVVAELQPHGILKLQCTNSQWGDCGGGTLIMEKFDAARQKEQC